MLAIDEQSEDNAEQLAAQFSALSHPARIGILQHLAGHKGRGCSAIVSHLPLAQSTVSQHLKVLLEAGLIRCEINPPHSLYSLNEPALLNLTGSVSKLVDSCCGSGCCGANKDNPAKHTA